MTRLLAIAAPLEQTRKELVLCGGYERSLYEKASSQIHDIVESIKDKEPFYHFNIEASLGVVDDIFSNENLDMFDKILNGETVSNGAELKQKYDLSQALITVYAYLAIDTANFATMIQNFTTLIMESNSRQKSELAECAYMFFNDKTIRELLRESNPNKYFNGINTRPRISQAYVHLTNENGKSYIARRVYFGRLMDFLVEEWYEGLMRGHYLWRCGVCEKHFLMTTARRRLYCKSFNPQYGTTCDHAANNRKIAKQQNLSKQSKRDNPLWIVRNKRYASLRKNKSLGKYSEAVTEAAKNILDNFYQQAECDTEYAKEKYAEDIALDNLYALAKEQIGEE